MEGAQMDFSGKVVLVTGASSGIGEATAERFAALGAAVAVNSRSSVEDGTAVAERIGGSYHQADIADEGAVLGMIEDVVATHGGIDVLINNAGTTQVIPHGDLDAVTDEVWHRILDVNILGTWYASRGAVPHLRKSPNGSIVNITSIAGSNAVGSCIPYSVSKAGLDQMTILLANALGPDVRVNAVAPGLVRT
ncbi:MAG: SDR family oxidoreductase, partial [Acidimicrobiia bacterium]|nr:SDR family oxidoreductase [Acidimicrobiia bacterium]